jgi:hypothetical protein
MAGRDWRRWPWALARGELLRSRRPQRYEDPMDRAAAEMCGLSFGHAPHPDAHDHTMCYALADVALTLTQAARIDPSLASSEPADTVDGAKITAVFPYRNHIDVLLGDGRTLHLTAAWAAS